MMFFRLTSPRIMPCDFMIETQGARFAVAQLGIELRDRHRRNRRRRQLQEFRNSRARLVRIGARIGRAFVEAGAERLDRVLISVRPRPSCSRIR